MKIQSLPTNTPSLVRSGNLPGHSSPLSPGVDKVVLSQGPSQPPTPPRSAFSETVAETVEDWGHMGKKLGSLAAVSYLASALPLWGLTATMGRIPDALFGPVAIGMLVAALPVAALEEKHLGIGKHLGGLAGKALGAGAGVIKGAFQELAGPAAAAPEKVELKRQAPGQIKPFRPLAQKGLDMAFGEIKQRSKALEVSELVGATASTMVVAYTVPSMIGNLVGGPVGNALATTMVGPLTGMVLGGLAESTLGIGRAAGELVGRAIDKLSPAPEGGAPQPAKPPAPKSEPGLLKKGFLEFNHLVGQPMIGYLLDTTIAGNRLLARTPVQTMEFSERPPATVNRQRLIDNFVSLAGIHGPSGEEKLVGDELEKRLQKLDISYERRPDGNIIATWPATPGYEDSPTVMFSAHQDTVAPTKLENIRIGERRIHTNEKSILGADDRAGIAQIMEGLESVKEQGLPHPEVKLVFTVDEERGLVGATALKTEDISTRPTLGYVVDALDVRDVHLTNDAVIVNPNSVKYNYGQEDPLVQVLYQSMANAGLKPRPIPAPILTGAGSDANTKAFNSGPIRSMAIGVGERDMHTPLEYIKIKDLEQAAKHVVGCITFPCDLKVDGNDIVPRQAFKGE